MSLDQPVFELPICNVCNKPWVSLTDEEMDSAYFDWEWSEISTSTGESCTGFARFIEAKLKEKNHD